MAVMKLVPKGTTSKIDWAKVDWTKIVKYQKDGKTIDYIHADSNLIKVFDQRKMDIPVLLVDALLRMRGPIAVSRKYHGENVCYEKYFIKMDIFEPEVHSWDILTTYPELLGEEVDDILLTNKCGCWFFDVSLTDVSTTDEEVERIAAEDNRKPIAVNKLVPVEVDDNGDGWYRLESEDEMQERMEKYGRSIKNEH